MSVTSGVRLSEFWGKQSQDGSWERTSQDCLPLNLEPSLEGASMTWPAWGIAWDGVVGELTTLAQFTGGGGYSSLPTPSVQEPGWVHLEIVDKNGNPTTNPNERWYDKQTGRLVQKGLQQVMVKQLLPTPNTMDHLPPRSAEALERAKTKGGCHNLKDVLLPTARASQAMSRPLANYPSGSKGRLEGEMARELLPTPAASQNHKAVRPLAPSERDGTHGTMLVGALGEEIGDLGESRRLYLNPQFVAKMMGFPPGWFDLGETPA